jgi:hypothetical protein
MPFVFVICINGKKGGIFILLLHITEYLTFYRVVFPLTSLFCNRAYSWLYDNTYVHCYVKKKTFFTSEELSFACMPPHFFPFQNVLMVKCDN